MVDVRVDNRTLIIGHANDSNAFRFIFEIVERIHSAHGENGTFTVLHKRAKEAEAYPVANVTSDDQNLYWTVSGADTAKVGYGQLQIRYVVDDVVVHTEIFTTKTLASIVPGEEAPDDWKPWIDLLGEYRDEAEAAAMRSDVNAASASESATNASQSEEAAGQSAISAHASEVSANASANRASASAASASVSEANAKESEDNAKASADSASASASSASASASSASTSATNAKASENLAKQYADDAKEAKEEAEGLLDSKMDKHNPVGDGTFAFGEGADPGLEGFAVGKNAKTPLGGFALGEGTATNISSAKQFAAGRYNDPQRHHLFMVGNGTSDSNRKNAFAVNDGSIEVDGEIVTKANLSNMKGMISKGFATPEELLNYVKGIKEIAVTGSMDFRFDAMGIAFDLGAIPYSGAIDPVPLLEAEGVTFNNVSATKEGEYYVSLSFEYRCTSPGTKPLKYTIYKEA